MAMDIGSIHEKKINEAEKYMYNKEGRFFAVAKKNTWLTTAQKNKGADIYEGQYYSSLLKKYKS